MTLSLIPSTGSYATTEVPSTAGNADQHNEGSWTWSGLASRTLCVVAGACALGTAATAGTPAIIVGLAISSAMKQFERATAPVHPFSNAGLNPIQHVVWAAGETNEQDTITPTGSTVTIEVIEETPAPLPMLEYKPAQTPPTAEEIIAGLDYVDRNQAGGLFAKWTVNWLISSVKSTVAGHTFSARVQNMTARFLDCFSWGLTKERLATILKVEENEFARLLNRRVAS